MRKFILTFMSIIALQALSAQSNVSGTITSGGLQREYLLYVPAIYNSNTPVPLVINLHGYSSNNIEQAFYGDFRGIADTANFLIVHPNGTLDGTGTRFWNTFLFPSSVDDVAFLHDLIDSLSAQYNINPNRIYSTGMSNGGFMSYSMACESDRIAAIASVTGSMITPKLNACTPNRPVPVMEIHGTADMVVPFDGSASMGFVPIPDLVAAWVAKNNCNPTPIITPVPNTSTIDLTTSEHYVYSGGTNGSSVEFYKVTGGGHTWPGAIFNIGVTSQDFKASQEIWRFFSKYRLDQFTDTRNPVSVEPQWSVAPNPAGDHIMLQSKEAASVSQVQIFDVSGRLVTQLAATDQQQIRIETATWSRGLYLLVVRTTNGSIERIQFVKS